MPGQAFQVIPVLDVLDGAAVHAVAGERSHYRPIRSGLHPGSEPLGLARAYRDLLGLGSLYVADLDAILHGTPNRSLYRELSCLGLDLWIDPGLRACEDVARLADVPHATLVAGLETIRGPDTLRQVLEGLGPERVVFSLDLKRGRPLTAEGAEWSSDDPLRLCGEAVELGARQLLVLDLARVGTGRGTGSDDLLRALHQEFRSARLELSVGGGIAAIEEVVAARDAGASAVMLGSALHDGRITRPMLERLRQGPD
jgi:phosphoribosylformimino-5-aminoimidazole carboxamide ribotide isomerase